MKKMLPWLITILLAIALIAVVAVFLFNQFFDDSGKDAAAAAIESVEAVKPEKISASERVELTAEIQDIRTNLLDTDYVVVMNFAFQLDSKKTKEDFEKIKDIQIKPIIIRTLSDMTPEELKGSKGKDALTAKLLNLINPELPEKSKLTKVEITNFIITTI
ncbi:MAG TPA: flagellar basal body-associated FliL family protein [Paenibacillus sp.]|uniref:flagellar basal body-associated FliL family protein n=1 Tax=Paenibacillus sp. TaxID=58172 RepID=UPI0028D5D225|nr:flagellar basal body-associated FliL family protein [Paenibacillus sp.]HUC90965.1 flagellar basal body-associated FliL family protein [Paenibacillus sp.]